VEGSLFILQAVTTKLPSLLYIFVVDSSLDDRAR